MSRTTFDFSDATITVHSETIADLLGIEVLLNQLNIALGYPNTEEDRHARNQFARFYRLSEIDGDIGLPSDDIDVVFQAWLRLDGELYTRWLQAINSL